MKGREVALVVWLVDLPDEQAYVRKRDIPTCLRCG